MISKYSREIPQLQSMLFQPEVQTSWIVYNQHFTSLLSSLAADSQFAFTKHWCTDAGAANQKNKNTNNETRKSLITVVQECSWYYSNFILRDFYVF